MAACTQRSSCPLVINYYTLSSDASLGCLCSICANMAQNAIYHLEATCRVALRWSRSLWSEDANAHNLKGFKHWIIMIMMMMMMMMMMMITKQSLNNKQEIKLFTNRWAWGKCLREGSTRWDTSNKQSMWYSWQPCKQQPPRHHQWSYWKNQWR